MKKVVLILGALFVYHSGLYAFTMRGESEKAHYNIVSMTAKIVIECENGEKSFIKKYKDLYYASKSAGFRSFEKAAKYACRLKFKNHITKKRTKKVRKNARLRKNAIVCRTQKSIIYLLKNTKHYQSVLNKLQSRNVYKNCFIGKANYPVAVTNHYHNKNLIHNYYKMRYGDNNGDNVRYTPIISIKPIGANKKHYSRSKTKVEKSKRKKVLSHKKVRVREKKKYRIAERTQVKKILRHKAPITVENTFVLHKRKPESSLCVNNSEEIATVQDKNSIKEYSQIQDNQRIDVETSLSHQNSNNVVTNNEPSIVEKRDTSDSSTTETIERLNDEQKSDLVGTKIYRCSASSTQTGKIFVGQHLDSESSKNIALKNCQDEEKNSENCQFEHCFILDLM